MTERTPITNFLLLSVLAGILLISGSLQCAFDCLVQADGLYAGPTHYSYSTRVDSCHLSSDHATPTVCCLNKTCHQRLPYQRDLGGPELFSLNKLPQPIYSSNRQPEPLYRAGTAIISSPASLQPCAKLLATSSDNVPQTLLSIRTTILLC